MFRRKEEEKEILLCMRTKIFLIENSNRHTIIKINLERFLLLKFKTLAFFIIVMVHLRKAKITIFLLRDTIRTKPWNEICY